jgi:hypothetical protein
LLLSLGLSTLLLTDQSLELFRTQLDRWNHALGGLSGLLTLTGLRLRLSTLRRLTAL